MKKYKRSKIIVSVALLSSLAMSNIAFAANDLSRTAASARSEMHAHEESTSFSTPKTPDRSKRGSKKKSGKSASSFTNFVGEVSSVNGDSFTIGSYVVTTNDGTVFMKNGHLDSESLGVGSKVVVKGTLDSSTNTVTAKGVHVIVE